MAERPESRAVRTTRAQKARPPADDVRPGVAATTAAEASAAPASPKQETRAAAVRPSRVRGAKAETQPADAVQAAVEAPSRKTRKPKAAESPAVATPTGEPAAAKRARTGDAARPARKAGTARKPAPARTSKRPPPYLAAELGQPVDHEGEPIGAGSPMARSDRELQDYTLQLWQQMQSRRGVNQHVQAMERAGLTIDDLWTTGVTDRLSTSSTPDEVRRYRQNLLFRANLLEAILSETVAELRRLETVEPTPASATGSG